MARMGLVVGLCVGLVVCASVDALACSPNRRSKYTRYVKPVDLDEGPDVRPGHAVFYATPLSFDQNDFWDEYPPGEIKTRATLTVRVNDVLLGDVRGGETVELNVGPFRSGCTKTNAIFDLLDNVLGESEEVLPGRELLVDIDTAEWLGLTRRRAFSGRHWWNELRGKGSNWRVLEPGEEHARSFEELARRLNHDEYGSYVGKGLLPLEKVIVIETEDGPIAPEIPEPEHVPELMSFEDRIVQVKTRASECVPVAEWAEALGSDLIVHGTVTSAYQKGAHGEVSYRLKVGKAYKFRAPKVPDEVTLYASELTPGFRPEIGTPYLIYARGTAMGFVASACGASHFVSQAPWSVGPWMGLEPGRLAFEENRWARERIWNLEPVRDEPVRDEPGELPPLSEVFAGEFEASGGRAGLWAALLALVAIVMVKVYRRRA